MNQLETMIRQRYLKSKTTKISSIIKSGLLSEGFDWGRSSLHEGGVGDYVMDLLIELVVVHEELNRYNPTLVGSFLSLLLEQIYQVYNQWIAYIDNFSIFGMLQMGMELKFINKIMQNYKTPISDSLYTSIDQKYQFVHVLEKGEIHGQQQLKQITQIRNDAKKMLEKKVQASSLLFSCFHEEEDE